ncbi:MAG TPA: transglycosylase domain-containing protein [Solirubrobacteraceae bacterium]|jgi:penicillin-binding protein 1A|nr:transglycosylase domain-containing protein [Solirubrobacteraceae bacterium]
MTGVLIVCAVTVGAMAIAGWVINVAQSAPNLNTLKPFVPGSPSQVFAGDGTSLGYIWSPSVHTEIAGSRIPQMLKDATVAIEDRRFYQHGALDYQGIVRAAIKDAVKGGNGLQGASTLTMQLVDNTYLPHRYRNNHDLKYKIVQAKLAEQLEAQHSKDWILDNYLNDVPYGAAGGQTAYGVAAASQIFFDKPVQKLSLAQIALLAGLPQAPTTYNPFGNPSDALRRRAEVLQSMVTAGYITQEQSDRAASRPLELKPDNTLRIHKDPYVFDFIVQQAARDLCPKTPNSCKPLQNGGLKIYSTIDLRKQALASQSIIDHESLLAEQGHGTAGAAVASVNTSNGHILAIATSGSYADTQVDYATSAHRQPGSSFKTFALMTLIHDDDGDPNSTYYVSKPLAPGWLSADPTWEVHTAEDSYQGDINITKATILSDNTVYVQLAADLGWDKLDATARSMGVTSPLDGNPSEVIGGLRVGVTPLEMADAYATLANGGQHFPATIIDKVNFPDGSSRDFGNSTGTRVFPYDEAYEGTGVLKQVVTSGTGTPANYGCPVAGKTGTANNLENAWFVGYSPRMSTAVWVGYPQGNIPMNDGFGGALAAPIWNQYMKDASSGYCGDWNPPEIPFQGKPFFGPFATTGQPVAPPKTSTVAPSTSTTPSGGAGIGGTGTSTTPYNNPTLYQHPPQPGAGTTTTPPPAHNPPGGTGAAGGNGPATH